MKEWFSAFWVWADELVCSSDPIPRDFSNEEIHCLEVRKLCFRALELGNCFRALELGNSFRALGLGNRLSLPLNYEFFNCCNAIETLYYAENSFHILGDVVKSFMELNSMMIEVHSLFYFAQNEKLFIK